MTLYLLLCGWLVFLLYGMRARIAYRLIRAKAEAGNYDAALRRLRALRFALTAPYSQHLEASILHYAGRVAEAEALYREALGTARTGAGFPCQPFYYSLGRALGDLGRFEEAGEFLNQAIAAGDLTGSPPNGLAEIGVAQGRLAEALHFSEQAVETAGRRVKPEFLGIYYAVQAWILALESRPDDARESLRLAMPEDRYSATNRAWLHWRKGLALVALGQNEEAYEQFRIGCRVDPRGLLGQRCLEELRKRGESIESKSSEAAAASWRHDRAFAWAREWKGIAAVAVLFPLAMVTCPLLMRISPGPSPDFRDSGSLHRFSGDRWIDVPAVRGGVEHVAVSPSGAIWAMSPSRKAVLRWDGDRWMRYSAAQLGAHKAIGLALRDDEAWVATDESVARFDGRNWQPYRTVSLTRAAAIAAGPSGVWLIDRSAILAHYDGSGWTFENLRSTPAGADWDQRIEDGEPQLRVADDGALWLLLGGLWRRDESGWSDYPVGNVDWCNTVMLAHGTGNVWLQTAGYIFELRPENLLGALYRPRDLPIQRESGLFDIAQAGGKTWLATTKNLLAFEGGKWRRQGLPSGGTLVKEVAAAPDGSVWVVSENRPVWRVALWVAPMLAAATLALLAIGGLAVVWARAASTKRWATHRAAMHAAGIVLSPEDAAAERCREKGDRALWWKLPLFLAGVPVLVEGTKWLRLYFEGVWPDSPGWVSWAVATSPIAAVLAFMAVRWLRQWLKPMPALATETLSIRVVLYLAVSPFALSELSSGGTALNGVAIAVLVLVLMRNAIARQLTNPLLRSGNYDRALRRLRWLSFPRPTAWMTFQKGQLLSAAARHAEAERSYRQALAVSANARPAFRNHLLLCLAYTLTDLSRYEEARRCLETVIDLGDPDGGARLGIADLLLQQASEPGKALSFVEESMRICSAGWYKAERMGNKAWALALMGKREEMGDPVEAALQGTAEGLQHVGAAASIHWRVGKALAAAERVSEAIEQFRAAFHVDPRGHHGLLARAELANYGTAP